MNVNFKYTVPDAVDPIRIEQVFAEKPAGGIIAAPTFNVPSTTAVGFNGSSKLAPIKAYRLVAAVAAVDTKIKIAKGSGVVVGDVIARGKKGVACTAVNTTNADYDEVTVTMGIVIANGTVLYQAAAASADSAVPIYTPKFVTGNDIVGNEGAQSVRLITGANLRKETANISDEVVAMLPTINLV